MSGAVSKRSRRGRGNDDDDDEPIAVAVAPTTTTTTEAPAAAAAAAPVVSRRKFKAPDYADDSTTTTTAPATAAAPATAPPAAPAAAPPSAPPAAAAAGGRHADPTTTAAGGASGADCLYSMDFDAMSFSAFTTACLAAYTRAQVEHAMTNRIQSEEHHHQQLEGNRVEKFLDVSAAGLSPATPSPSPAPGTAADSDSGVEDHKEGYAYGEMLSRLYEQLNRNGKGGGGVQERNQVPVPILEKIGKKKTAIANFGRICEVIHRPVEDLKDYIEKELAIRGNLDSNNALIIKYQTNKANDFDGIIIKFLDEFVKCNSCHRIDTTLTKDGRRMELRCNWCTATRTVTATGTAAYTAQIEKRSRQRAAMTL